MTYIKDLTFVRTLARRFCLRSVSDRASRNALQRRWVDVRSGPDGHVIVAVCEDQDRLIEISWDGTLAAPLRVHPFDAAIRDADPQELSKFVGRFLKKHRVLDGKRGVA